MLDTYTLEWELNTHYYPECLYTDIHDLFDRLSVVLEGIEGK